MLFVILVLDSNLLVKVVCVVNGGECAERFYFFSSSSVLICIRFPPFLFRWSKLKLVAIFFFPFEIDFQTQAVFFFFFSQVGC